MDQTGAVVSGATVVTTAERVLFDDSAVSVPKRTTLAKALDSLVVMPETDVEPGADYDLWSCIQVVSHGVGMSTVKRELGSRLLYSTASSRT